MASQQCYLILIVILIFHAVHMTHSAAKSRHSSKQSKESSKVDEVQRSSNSDESLDEVVSTTDILSALKLVVPIIDLLGSQHHQISLRHNRVSQKEETQPHKHHHHRESHKNHNESSKEQIEHHKKHHKESIKRHHESHDEQNVFPKEHYSEQPKNEHKSSSSHHNNQSEYQQVDEVQQTNDSDVSLDKVVNKFDVPNIDLLDSSKKLRGVPSGINGSRYTYATFIASDNFFPALEVFLYTFTINKMIHPLSICIAEVPNYLDIVNKTLHIIQKYGSTINYQIYILPLIPGPKHSGEHKRWVVNWTKIQLWSLLEYEKVLYVDLDVIFVRNTDCVFVDYNVTNYRGTYDWGRYTRLDSQKMNGGVFLLRPSLLIRSVLLSVYNNVRAYRHQEAEQGLFNYVFGGKEPCLPFQFNVQKTVSDHIPAIWRLDSIFILHFTGEKPWNSWSTSYFRSEYVDRSEIKLRIRMDQWDADRYQVLHDLWKGYYLKARASELDSLTIYQMYHDPSCWDTMSRQSFYKGLRLSGAMRSEGDVNAPLLYSELTNSSYQLALGEFGGMVAISKLNRQNLPPFVGFTSWKEAIKYDWKEGASIDWTKVDFKENTIYFWYSIPNDKSYLETIERQHTGMLAVLVDLISSTSTSTSSIPEMSSSLRYSYSNYFITSRDVFLSYMESSKYVLDSFIAKYPVGSKCPYEIPSFIVNGEMRCVGYLMERYINIWAMQHNVSMVYAVDEPSWRLK